MEEGRKRPSSKIYRFFCAFRLTRRRFLVYETVLLRQHFICSGIEVVITSTTGNRVAVKSGTRVQIPPTAPY